MLRECLQELAHWRMLDTQIVLIAALAAMACTVPGNYLLLRRQSLMGDALSHTSLLGIVLAFFLHDWLLSHVGSQSTLGIWLPTAHWMMFGGAMLIGILAALLAETIQKVGRVESTAALGVVFTTMFAMGLLLIGIVDTGHLDANCVLYGSVTTMIMDKFGETQIPQALVVNGAMLAFNLALVALFFKELRLSTFDPELASALGINPLAINYVLMAVTAASLVAVFESVGSILAIAMLIVPAATAFLLTSRLERMIPLSLLLAGASALVGHTLAMAVPPVLFARLGFEHVGAASTAGMMAATSGGFFFLALCFAPRQGMVSRLVNQAALTLKIAEDDLLGLLFRKEERPTDQQPTTRQELLSQRPGYPRLFTWYAAWRLLRRRELTRLDHAYHLTEQGRQRALGLVRAHRLWESYMAQHFNLSDERLHQSAHWIEHYLDPPLREDLASELQSPTTDPHGRTIPEEQPADPA